MLKNYRFVTLDAFTTTPFCGNPCAVLPEADGLTGEQMQQIARETNMPETAFVTRSEKANYRVRYFTPRSEVSFAGHPTIATSFLLAQEKMIPLDGSSVTTRLEFNIGILPVEIRLENGQPVESIMTQALPTYGATLSTAETAPCFGLAESDLRDDCPIQVVNTGAAFLIVAARSVDVLGKVVMDRPRLAHLLDRIGVSAAFMFSIGGFDPLADTHARMFDPRNAGEDPYTGSAAGCMGAFLVHYGLITGPKIIAEQGHFVHRPGVGVLDIRSENGAITSVRLAGSAVKTMEGRIFVQE